MSEARLLGAIFELRVGERVSTLDEIGMEGVATVISIRGWPELEPGEGRVVLGVISHVDHDVYGPQGD